MRALIGKELDLISWDGDPWEDPDEAGDIEPLNCDESFITSGIGLPSPSRDGFLNPSGSGLSTYRVSAFPSPSERINPALPEERVIASPDATVM